MTIDDCGGMLDGGLLTRFHDLPVPMVAASAIVHRESWSLGSSAGLPGAGRDGLS